MEKSKSKINNFFNKDLEIIASVIVEGEKNIVYSTDNWDIKDDLDHIKSIWGKKENRHLYLDGNKFLSKHIGIVGSTGSGKSCTVAKLLQNIVGIKNGINEYEDNQKNSHIIIFDIHSEYQSAFDLEKKESFSLNVLDIGNLK